MRSLKLATTEGLWVAATRSHLDPINQDIHAIPIVEAYEAFNSGTFMRWVWVVPNRILLLLAIDFEVEVPGGVSVRKNTNYYAG